MGTSSDTGDLSLITNMVDTIIKAGPTTVIFAGLWWTERKERMMLRDRLLETSESVAEMNRTWLRILPKRSTRREDRREEKDE
jgi:hypothetical protein